MIEIEMRVADALKYCVALPVCPAFEVIRYASVQQTRSGKIGVVIAMLPILAFVTVCWATLWAFAMTLFAKLINW